MPRKVFEVPRGGLFLVVLPNTRTNRPRGVPISRKPTTGTTKRFAGRIGITTNRKAVASSRKQRKTTPSPIDTGERAARHQNFTGKAITHWNESDLVSAFVHGLFGQEKAHTRCHWRFANGNMGPNAQNGILSSTQRPTEVAKRRYCNSNHLVWLPCWGTTSYHGPR